MLGSSASLKSSWKPRDLSEPKKREWDDLTAKSSRRIRTRRSVGDSGENETQSNGSRETVRAMYSEKFFIFLTNFFGF